MVDKKKLTVYYPLTTVMLKKRNAIYDVVILWNGLGMNYRAAIEISQLRLRRRTFRAIQKATSSLFSSQNDANYEKPSIAQKKN